TVISDNYASAGLEPRADCACQTAGQFGWNFIARFAVNSHHLLFLCDDPSLETGAPPSVSHPALASDTVRHQQPLELLRGVVPSSHAEQFRRDTQSGKIPRHISRTAWHETLSLKIHDRNRRFG